MYGTPGPAPTAAAPLWSVLLVPALGLALGVCGAVLSAADGQRLAGDPGPGALIGLVAAAVGCAVVLVWGLAAVLALLAVLAGHHRWERLAVVCRRCSPALLRRAAATALGMQLLGAPAAVADGAPSPFWDAGTAVQEAPAPDGSAPSPGPAPDPGRDLGRDLGGTPAPVPPTTEEPCGARAGSSPAERTVDGAVTVVRGDTLWSLTAAHLGPGASDEQIARAWPVWYELNRHVLVDGPHRLLPGQRLLVPGTGEP